MEKEFCMATYKEIQEYVKKEHNVSVKTCHIAFVKRAKCIPMRTNRTKAYKYPCPAKYFPYIEEALKHFSMI